MSTPYLLIKLLLSKADTKLTQQEFTTLRRKGYVYRNNLGKFLVTPKGEKYYKKRL